MRVPFGDPKPAFVLVADLARFEQVTKKRIVDSTLDHPAAGVRSDLDWAVEAVTMHHLCHVVGKAVKDAIILIQRRIDVDDPGT